MKRCSTCKWMAEPFPVVRQDLQLCQRIGLESKAGLRDSLAFVQDYTDYWAALYVRPNFGCVMHEEKDHELE